MKVVLTGSRNWTNPGDRQMEYAILDGLLQLAVARGEGLTLIAGGNKNGADAVAKQWAQEYESRWPKGDFGFSTAPFAVDYQEFLPDYEAHGSPSAPHIRNREMIEQKPNVVFAFKGEEEWDATLQSGGTESTVRLALSANIPTYLISRLGPVS